MPRTRAIIRAFIEQAFARRTLVVLSAVLLGGITLRPIVHPQIAVLLFHQVSDTPIESAHGVDLIQRPWITPAAFDALLGKLAAQGYTVISLRSALDYLEGKSDGASLPPKPALITFDDGYRSALTQATPILRKHHAVATMFFEGHATDNASMQGRLDSADLTTMERSGVWSLESHGWAGHSDLPVDASGASSPYWYANLAWLADQSRFETPDEYERRVSADLLRMRTTYEPLLGTAITGFAYPCGEYGQNSALEPGANPQTLIEAGHSNAPGLTPRLIRALTSAGYEAAFAVSVPDTAHLASPSDARWALPRIGVGAGFQQAFLDALAAKDGIEYPEVADGQFADVGPLCAVGGTVYAAATNRPVLFTLDERGHLLASQTIATLADDRPSKRASISALSCDVNGIDVVQQAGFDPQPQPWINHFARDGANVSLVSRRPLPTAMNWLVGIARSGETLYGIDDHGNLFDLTAGNAIGILDPDIPLTARDGRFAGLAWRHGLLYTVDRITHELLAFRADRTIVARAPIDPRAHDLTFEHDRLLVTFWGSNRRSLHIYDFQETTP